MNTNDDSTRRQATELVTALPSAAVSGSAADERAVRKMRDQVYGVPISDKEWAQCKPNWMKPEETEWLRAQCAKQPNVELSHAEINPKGTP